MVVEIGPQLPAALGSLEPVDPRLPAPGLHRRVRAPGPRDPAGRRRGRVPGGPRQDAARRGYATPTTSAAPGRPASRPPSSMPRATCWGRSAPRGRSSATPAKTRDTRTTCGQVKRAAQDDHGSCCPGGAPMTGPVGSTVLPRSFLYVPATRPDLFDKAAAGARRTPIVLDLEDAVPVPAKDEARGAVRAWLEGGAGSAATQTWVRVDADALAGRPARGSAPRAPRRLRRQVLVGVAGGGRPAPRRARARHRDDGRRRPGRRTRRERLGAARARRHDEPPRRPTFGVGEVDLLADLRMTRSPGRRLRSTRCGSQIVVHGCRRRASTPRSRRPRPTSATSRRSPRAPGTWSTWGSARVRRSTPARCP